MIRLEEWIKKSRTEYSATWERITLCTVHVVESVEIRSEV